MALGQVKAQGSLRHLVQFISSTKDTKKELLVAQFLLGIPEPSYQLLKAYKLANKASLEQLIKYA